MPKQNLLSLLASAFVGLSSLVHEASASPIPPSEYFSKPPITDIFDFDKVFREINKPRFNPRDGVLLTYEEWKACEEAPQYPKTKEEIKQDRKSVV